MEHPKVSVVMSVYNGEKHLREAVDSILNQTFTDFEFIIINDGSTDKTREILESYSDHRIRLFHQENIGLTKSLNRGIELARGEYIARMDDDDISLPQRLEKQVRYFSSNHDVGICGTWLKTIGQNEGQVWEVPQDHEVIKCMMLFYSVLYHPTVMFRKDIIEKFTLYYDESFQQAQDYHLWVRASEHTKLSNIQEILLLRRVHPNAVGCKDSAKQNRNADKVRFLQIQKLGIQPTVKEIETHRSLCNWDIKQDYQFCRNVDLWLNKLKAQNEHGLCFPEPEFTNLLTEKWSLVFNTFPVTSRIRLQIILHSKFIDRHKKIFLLKNMLGLLFLRHFQLKR